MTMTLDGTNGVTFFDTSLQGAAASPYGLKNRIINGDMVIDQRNAGASLTPVDGQYSLDRFACYLSQSSKYTVQQSSTAPTGFTNSLKVTSSSSYSVLASDYFGLVQYIEGYNVADLGFGSASAKTTTISFWVQSSLTGTFGGAIRNSAGNRIYPFTYTISVANTWELKSVTIAGDTSGTWLTTNGVGIAVWFGLGVGSTYSATANAWTTQVGTISATGATSVVGTNGATFYITGIQLEQNTVATPFERRLYDKELISCQRYLPVIQNNTGEKLVGPALTTTRINVSMPYQVTPRVPPTGITATTASNFGIYIPATAGQPTPTSITFSSAGVITASINVDVASGFTAGQFVQFFPNNSSAQILFTGCEL